MTSPERPVLVVDDDPDDRFLLRQAWAQAAIARPLREAVDGSSAIDYLSGAGEFADRSRFPLPILILLDIKMPNMSGFAVLDWIRASETASLLPVVMLTASTSGRDVIDAYRRGANSFLVKPTSLDELVEMLRALDRYWLHYNQPPATAPAGGESVPDGPSST